MSFFRSKGFRIFTKVVYYAGSLAGYSAMQISKGIQEREKEAQKEKELDSEQ